MNGAGSAVNLATRLEDVGFEEFTANLIDSTFRALLDAHIKQLEAYADLIQEIVEGLDRFIQKYRDTISTQEAYDYIGFSLEDYITQSQLDYLNSFIPEGKDLDYNETQDGNITINERPDPPQSDKVYRQDLVELIKEQILRRRFNILENLVTKGLIRLVVDFGEIETKLLFSVYGVSTITSTESSKDVSTSSLSVAGSLGYKSRKLSVNVSGGYSRFKLGVRTTSTYDRDTTGSKIDIFARVYIRFKSDYMPLNPAEAGTQG